MGSELAAKFGAKYLIVALTFSSGDFSAYFSSQGVVTGGLQSHTIGGAWPGSIEALFDATGASRLVFDARAIRNGGTTVAALRNRLTMRSIGATFAPTSPLGAYQSVMALPDDYDLVIWFRHATASRVSLGAISNALPNPNPH